MGESVELKNLCVPLVAVRIFYLSGVICYQTRAGVLPAYPKMMFRRKIEACVKLL